MLENTRARADSTQLQRHDQHLGELLLRVNQHAPLKAELRAAAAEVHAALTGAELGLLELPPTARPILTDAEAEDEEALLPALLRRLSVAGTEMVLGGRPGKSAAWAAPPRQANGALK